VDYSEQMEDHLYNKYFGERILATNTLYPHTFFRVSVNSSPSIKKADLIRIEKNTPEKVRTLDIYEYLLLDITEKVLKYRDKKSSKWLLQYFTLYKLSKNNIQHINRHVKSIIRDLLAAFEEELDIATLEPKEANAKFKERVEELKKVHPSLIIIGIDVSNIPN
jgi:hypothetical protein